MPPQSQGWHPEDIKAAVRKKGETLTNLALTNGMSEAACRVVLKRPGYAAEQIIADFIGVPAPELWPERYDRFGNPLHSYMQVKPSRSVLSRHRQKRRGP